MGYLNSACELKKSVLLLFSLRNYRSISETLEQGKPGRPGREESGQIRSGMGAYAGAARRRVHLATVLLCPPSGHRPGRRQARHARIRQIGLNLTQP